MLSIIILRRSNFYIYFMIIKLRIFWDGMRKKKTFFILKGV